MNHQVPLLVQTNTWIPDAKRGRSGFITLVDILENFLFDSLSPLFDESCNNGICFEAVELSTWEGNVSQQTLEKKSS
jgi:hypothetical protein